MPYSSSAFHARHPEHREGRAVLALERYVLYWRERLAGASSEWREIFKKYVEALISLGHPLGLEVKGYGCYGGNEVWPCDWQASAACLMELLKYPGKDFAANSLGYIYYYGRLHEGQRTTRRRLPISPGRQRPGFTRRATSWRICIRMATSCLRIGPRPMI